MELIDKNIAEKIAKENKTTIKKLGLRFDKVVVRLLSDLRASIGSNIPEGTAVLYTITAPIKLPTKMELGLSQQIRDVLNSAVRNTDHQSTIFQNQICIRIINVPTNQTENFAGFVHNPECNSKQLLDFAARWLRESEK